MWVGHLSKLVAEDDLSDMFGEIGTVETIHLIPPRGCAYVCMNRRQDAYKAIKNLNKKKLHNKPCTVRVPLIPFMYLRQLLNVSCHRLRGPLAKA